MRRAPNSPLPRGLTRRNPRESGLQPLVVLLLVVLVGGGLWVALGPRLGGDEQTSVRGALVQRGPLRISVIERGNLKAADSVSLKSEIEGQTTILKLVPEGTMVQAGDLLCELDATALIDKRFQQEISVRNAEAAHVKSRQNYEIQKSQNDSDIKRAEQSLRFAEMDLRKFQEGERLATEAEADEAIKLAEEEFTRAGDNLEWSSKLNERGFLTNTELEADRLSLSRTQIQLEQAKRDKDLTVRFQLPRDEADLISKLDEARRELERVKLQAAARIVDFEADMTTNEAKLRLEREKLQKLETQIAKSKLIAPRAGMVVYAVEEGGRYGSSQPIKEGTQVRERQDIVTIPSASGMIAQVSLHESVLKQVEAGQRAVIKIDALPGREFHGEVKFVSLMADQQSFWANPNLRLYRTEVTIDDAVAEMRPGMSCAIEILVEEISDTLFVPVQSIFRRGNQNLAFVEKGNASEEREVEVGRYNDRWVQILAGLSEGETVLLAPPASFSREVQEQEPEALPTGAEASPTAMGAPPGAGPGMGPGAVPGRGAPVDDGAVARPAGETRRGVRESDSAGGTGTLDAAAAEEARKRFEGMSEEERARDGVDARAARRGRRRGAAASGSGGLGRMTAGEAAAVPAVAELQQVTRTYRMGSNEVRALDELTFRFEQGEYWAVMGSSGSGKSTLLNVLGCLDRPNSGRYLIDGADVSRLSDDELSEIRSAKLGFVFQSYNLIPQLNVLENILVPLFYQDEPPAGAEERARALAERVGLGQRLDHRPMELSGGQQQRVAIARALVNHPSLILADEATGNLDSQTAQEILALFDELHAEGRTIVLVTHEPSVGERAQHVLRLKDGHIESVKRGQGSPALARQA